MKISIDGKEYEVTVRPGEVVVDGKAVPVSTHRRGNAATVEVGGKTRQVQFNGEQVVLDGKAYTVRLETAARPTPVPTPTPQQTVPRPAPVSAPRSAPAPAPDPVAPAAGTALRAPMPGKILRVLVNQGDNVAYGTVLMVLEAMKMENEIKSTAAGRVASLPVSAGSTVNAGDVLAVIS